MTNKEYRNAKRSRNLIQRSLTELLCQKGIDEITVTELAERADINRRTFYSHYANLADVLEEMESDMLTFLKEQRKANEDRSVSPETISTHITKLLETLPLQQMGACSNSPLLEELQKVADDYIDNCLQETADFHEKDSNLEMGLHTAAALTLNFVFRWASGSWHSELSYGQISEEIIQVCRKL